MLGLLKGLPLAAIGGIGALAGLALGLGLGAGAYEIFPGWLERAARQAHEAGAEEARAECRTNELEAQLDEVTRQRDAATFVLQETRKRAEARRPEREARQERIDDLERQAAKGSGCNVDSAVLGRVSRAWGYRE